MEVFEIEPGRWAYRVEAIYQEWHPDKPGSVAMTEEQATACAEEVLNRLEQS